MENNFSFNTEFLQLREEKKEQRRVANFAALSLIILFLIMFGWSFLYIRVMGNLGFAYEKAVELLENPAVNEMIQISVSLCMLIVPSLILARVLHIKIRDAVPLGLPKNKNNLAFFVSALGFCMFASQASSIGGAIIESFGIEFPSMDRELPTGVLGVILVILSTSLFPALLEEFMMRGVMLGAFKRFGDGFAIIASSVLFAFMHASLIQFAFAFLVGLVLGFVTVKAKSIWPAVLIHAANNLISIVFSYMELYVGTTVLNTVFYIFVGMLFVVAVISTIIVSRDTEFFKLEKADTISTEAQKIKWFLTAPAVIISIIAAVAISVFLR